MILFGNIFIQLIDKVPHFFKKIDKFLNFIDLSLVYICIKLEIMKFIRKNILIANIFILCSFLAFAFINYYGINYNSSCISDSDIYSDCCCCTDGSVENGNDCCCCCNSDINDADFPECSCNIDNQSNSSDDTPLLPSTNNTSTKLSLPVINHNNIFSVNISEKTFFYNFVINIFTFTPDIYLKNSNLRI